MNPRGLASKATGSRLQRWRRVVDRVYSGSDRIDYVVKDTAIRLREVPRIACYTHRRSDPGIFPEISILKNSKELDNLRVPNPEPMSLDEIHDLSLGLRHFSAERDMYEIKRRVAEFEVRAHPGLAARSEYSSYDDECKVLILGGGPNRIDLHRLFFTKPDSRRSW